MVKTVKSNLLIAGTCLLLVLPLDLIADGSYSDAMIKEVPHVRQKQDFCGEACVEMALKKLGHSINQDDVFNISGLDPLLARGCYTADLARAMKQIGFDAGTIWYSFNTTNATVEIEKQWKALHSDLVKGIPSIVCTHYNDQPGTSEHFRLVVGYDAKSDEIIYNEPAVEKGGYLRMKKDHFFKLWPLNSGNSTRQTVIRFRCQPSTITTITRKPGFTPADYAQHIMQLNKKISGKSFAIVIEPPFVVVGDEELETVRLRSEQTVRWAVKMLKQDYFKQDPDRILDIFLFKDKDSYEKNTAEIFNETPTTPFGFFSDEHHALIMNIATGGGTLVHEIVHPYMAANFTNCPSWFNEGLGSLYEQSQLRKGHIAGLVNWRLPGLVKEIKTDSLPSFPELLKTTSTEFYSSNRGNNYAQARYLCYYLQEKDLLVKFYKEFSNNSTKDPSGLETLQKVLGETDMNAFKKKWEKFVLKLMPD